MSINKDGVIPMPYLYSKVCSILDMNIMADIDLVIPYIDRLNMLNSLLPGSDPLLTMTNKGLDKRRIDIVSTAILVCKIDNVLGNLLPKILCLYEDKNLPRSRYDIDFRFQ
jgi:hypothetical protein